MPYEVEVLMEATDESVSGVGDSICRRAEELDAAAVSGGRCAPFFTALADGWSVLHLLASRGAGRRGGECCC